MFSAGQIFVTLGGQTARAGFDEFVGQVGRVSAFKEHHIRLSGDFVKDGFERYARAMHGAEQQGAQFGTAAERMGARVDAANRGIGESAARYLGLTREQLGYTSKQYATVAAAAQHSADVQRTAAAQGVQSAHHLADEHVKAAKKTDDAWKKGYSTMAGMGKATTIASAVIGGVGVKMAADFNREMELLHTQAGYTQKQVDQLSGSVKNLAPAVGYGPTKLAEGMYHLASSGISAADSMKVLKVAAEGAQIGHTDLEDTTNSLVHTLDALKVPANHAADVMGTLINIVGQGDMRMQDLNKAMGSGVVSAAHAFGLGLRDVGAALDTLTTAGVPAQQGANRLRTVLGLIENPTKKAQQALSELGITHTQLAEDMRNKGLVGMLDDLHSHMGKIFGHKLDAAEQRKEIDRYQKSLIAAGVTGKALDKQVGDFTRSLREQGSGATKAAQLVNQAFGGARMGTTMQILITQADEVRQKFDYLSTHSGAKILAANWADTQKQFSVQASQMWASLQKLMINIGERLIPVVEKMIHFFNRFGHYLGEHKRQAEVLATAIGVTLAAAVAAFFARFFQRTAEGIKAIGAFTEKMLGVGGAANKAATEVDAAQAKQTAAIDATTAALDREAGAAAAAATEMGRLAATGEAVTAGGVIIPRGVGKGGMLEEQLGLAGLAGRGGGAAGEVAGSTGILSRMGLAGLGFRGGASAIGRGALSAIGRASPWLIGASLAGPLIGGTAQGLGASHRLSSVLGGAGTGAALGAAAGSVVPIVGTGLGAAIGGVGGGLLSFFSGGHHKDPTKELKDFQKQVEAANKNLQTMPVKQLQALADQADRLANKFPKARDALHETKKEIDRVIGTRKDWDTVNKAIENFSTDGKKNLKSLTDRFNTNMRAIAHYMGFNTQQGKDAAQENVNRMVTNMDRLLRRGQLSTGSAMKQIFQMIRDNTGNSADAVRANFTRIYDSIHKAWEDGKVSTHDANVAIRKMAAEQSAGMKRDVEAQYKTMFANIKKQHDNGLLTDAEYTKKRRSLHHQMAKDIAGTEVNLTKTTGGILSGLNDTVDTAVGQMSKQLNVALKGLGLNPVKFALAPHSQQAKQIAQTVANIPELKPLSSLGSGAGTTSNPYGAQYGGPVPGVEFGREDHMLLVDPTGTPRARMAGDEWVFSRPQQAQVEMGLQMLGYRDVDEFWGNNRLGHTATYQMGGSVRRLAHGGSVPKTGMDNSSVVTRANFLDHLHLPYVWGGHHGDAMITDPRPGLDCSSTVSFVLGIPPRVSGGFENFGKAGPGPISIFANPTHVWMTIGGRPFGTSSQNPKGGAGWIKSMPGADYIRRFTVRHVGADWSGLGGSVDIPTLTGPDGGSKEFGQGIITHTGDAMNTFLSTRLASINSISGQPLNDSVATPGQAKGWINSAMKIAGVSGSLWEQMLARQASHESSFNPGAANTTPAGIAAGYPEGFLQVTRSTFGAYSLPGHKNIWDPVDNTVAAIRYIISRWGGGNATRAAQVMWARGGGAYKFGGALRRFAGGGRLGGVPGFQHGGAHHAGAHTATRHSAPKHKKATKHHVTAHLSKRPKAPPVLPHKLLKLGKFTDIPGVPSLDDADKEIQNIDTKYNEESNYFSIVDQTLTADDLGHLQDLRAQQLPLMEQEQSMITTEHNTLEGIQSDLQGRDQKVRDEARDVLNKIKKIKDKLKAEGRRLASLRHKRAGAALKIADELAKDISTKANKLSKIRKTEMDIRDRYRKKLVALHNAAPGDIGDQVSGIRKSYKDRIDKEPTTAGKKRLGDQRDRAVKGVEDGHRAAVRAHSRAIRNMHEEEQRALHPLERERLHIDDQMRHDREREGRERRRWGHRVWSTSWAITTEKWRLQDQLENLTKQEKQLIGTADITKGQEIIDQDKGAASSSLLGQILGQEGQVGAALTATDEAGAALPGNIVDNALNQLSVAGQRAQAQANETGQSVDLAALIPQGVQQILIDNGIAAGEIHRIFNPDATGTDAGGGTAATTPTQALMGQMQAMDQATQQLLQQFGSNLVAPGALAAALAGAGTVSAPGVRYFGGAGPALSGEAGFGPAGQAPTYNFYQDNHYSSGPQDPHIHAQSSRVEFQAAFG